MMGIANNIPMIIQLFQAAKRKPVQMQDDETTDKFNYRRWWINNWNKCIDACDAIAPRFV